LLPYKQHLPALVMAAGTRLMAAETHHSQRALQSQVSQYWLAVAAWSTGVI